MTTAYRFLAVSCLLLGVAGARPAAAQDIFGAIDSQLLRGEWQAARTAALAQVEIGRKVLYPPYLARAAARLAVAEAGLGQEEDAAWHWSIAENLDRSALSDKALATFGKAGEVLARHPLRGVNEAPKGWTVLRADDPAGTVQPDRKLEGELPPLSTAVGQLAAPASLEVQVVVDTEGRLREPVVISGGVPGMIWEVLEALRSWRFEPARQGDRAVAVFRDLTLHPPARTPLLQLTTLSRKSSKVEALLRRGKWQEADKDGVKAWLQELNDRHPSRERMAGVLALRALAEAGAGNTDVAICRWQAAQHLDKRLYDADLAPYGTAGQILDRNRWGVARAASASEGIQKPLVAERALLQYPSLHYPPVKSEAAKGTVVLAGIVDERGALHQPVILQLVSNALGDAAPSGALMDQSGARNLPRLMAISALDSLCDWHFRPASAGGQAVALQYFVPVGFDTGALPRLQALGLATGTGGMSGLHHDPRWDPPSLPRAQPGIPTW